MENKSSTTTTPAAAAAAAANNSTEGSGGKPRRPRRTFWQQNRSHFVFVALVIAAGLGLHRVAESGYFERHMEEVRRSNSAHFLARQRAMRNASVLPSGLTFSITRRGSDDRAPAFNEACEVHFRSSHRFFLTIEDTRDAGYPRLLAPSQLIPGAAEALQLMREGDKWYVIVPYDLAYGMEGNESLDIPSLANLRYEMEVMRCPATVSGRTSEEIDAYLAPFLKLPMPAKTAAPEATPRHAL